MAWVCKAASGTVSPAFIEDMTADRSTRSFVKGRGRGTRLNFGHFGKFFYFFLLPHTWSDLDHTSL